MIIEKTQTVRISPPIHRLAKIEAKEANMGLQQWIELLITKEIEEKNK